MEEINVAVYEIVFKIGKGNTGDGTKENLIA